MQQLDRAVAFLEATSMAASPTRVMVAGTSRFHGSSERVAAVFPLVTTE
jgi:hypothetical protein